MAVAEVRRSRPYHALIAIGLASYGLLHLVLAWIAIQIVIWRRGDASSEGALSQLRQQPFGEVLLWIMAIGLFTLTVWQALEATIGRDQPSRDGRLRRRLTSAGRAVVYFALGLLAVGVAVGSTSSSGEGEETFTAKLMGVPFGPVLVAAVGAVVIGVGVAQIVKGVKQNFIEDLDRSAPPLVRRLAPSATARGEWRLASSASCSAGRRSPTTLRRLAGWTMRSRQSGTSRSVRCCSRSWQLALPASVPTASSGREWRAIEPRIGAAVLGVP